MPSRSSESWQSLSESFFSYLAGQGQSQRSIQNYRSDILEFTGWLAHDQKKTRARSTLRNVDLDAFGRRLAETHSGSTVVRKIANAKRFTRWIEARHLSGSGLANVSADQTTREDLLKILERVKAQAAPRDSLILNLLVHSGLRVSEIIGLKWSDIDLYGSRGLLRVGDPTKHNVRMVELEPKTVRWLKDLGYGSAVGSREPVFHRNGKKMTRSAINVVVDRLSRLAGVRATPHTFRRLLAQRYDVASPGKISSYSRPDRWRAQDTSDLMRNSLGAKDWVTSRRISDTYQDLILPNLAKEANQKTNFVAVRSYVRQNPHVREAVRQRADRRCERCGFVADDPLLLQIHHIISIGEKCDSTDNCAALCANCHVLAHWLPRSATVEGELLELLKRMMSGGRAKKQDHK